MQTVLQGAAGDSKGDAAGLLRRFQLLANCLLGPCFIALSDEVSKDDAFVLGLLSCSFHGLDDEFFFGVHQMLHCQFLNPRPLVCKQCDCITDETQDLR